MSTVDSGHVEQARGMAQNVVEEHLDGDEQATEAVDSKADSLLTDDRGQVSNSAMNVVSLVVSLTVGAIIAAFLIPIGLDELVAVDTSSWSDGADALWNILDVIVVLALFLFFIAVALAASDRAGS